MEGHVVDAGRERRWRLVTGGLAGVRMLVATDTARGVPRRRERARVGVPVGGSGGAVRSRPRCGHRVRMRPYLLLVRFGLEAAAHATWLPDVPTKTFEECVKRHVRLMHHDFTLHKQALEACKSDAGRIEDRIAKPK